MKRPIPGMERKLVDGFGFTKEYAEPSLHAFMLVDQWVVDRSFGRRIQWKDWTYQTKAQLAANGAWNVVRQLDPSTSEQMHFLRQTATAVNPVCMNCKTQDHILDWKCMGEPDPKAKWSRTLFIVELAHTVSHPMNCYI